jgi:hypothetical protein
VCVVQYMVGKGLTFDSGGVCVVHCSGGVCVLYNTWLARALPSTLEVCV